jgi:AraC family transcriptional regulator
MPSDLSASPASFSFAEWYAQPVVAPLTSSETLGWRDLTLHVSQILATEELVTGPVVDDPSLIVVLDGQTQVRGKFAGKPTEAFWDSGSMMLVPARNETSGRWSDTVSAAFVRFSPGLMSTLAESMFRGDPDRCELLPLINLRDPLLHHLTRALHEELRNPSPLSAVFAESAAQTMMLQLLRKYSNKTARHAAPPRSGFSERQRRVIDDYIESHLTEKISLGELASLLFMSVPHFERTFRGATGYAPYQYVLERRLERAKWLLEHMDTSVYDVGRQCGFANQSHFTRHFTRKYGISPARFRYSVTSRQLPR